MKRIVTLCAALVVALSLMSGSALAAKSSSAGTKLRCFTGSPATCVVNSSSLSATLDTHNGGYAGVYYTNGKSISGTPVGAVSYSFTYYCYSSACVTGGSPRVSIPIDSSGDGKTDAYAFSDAANCGQSANQTGTVNNSCPVFYDNVLYADWAAFAAANPTYTVANSTPFVIADGPFFGLISNISITRS